MSPVLNPQSQCNSLCVRVDCTVLVMQVANARELEGSKGLLGVVNWASEKLLNAAHRLNVGVIAMTEEAVGDSHRGLTRSVSAGLALEPRERRPVLGSPGCCALRKLAKPGACLSGSRRFTNDVLHLANMAFREHLNVVSSDIALVAE